MSELDGWIEQVDFALWALDLKFSNFPANPEFHAKHTDDEGETWTYLGEHHGWAIIGSDRRDRGTSA